MAKEEVKKEESQARKDYKALIEAYAKKNPVKYELKKAELEAKLAKIA
jgi:phosphorylcholine metabolism protein LicD